MELSEGQELALRQLRRIAAVEGSALRIDNITSDARFDSALAVDVSIDCTHYEQTAEGLQLHARESLRLWIPVDFPYHLPRVTTAHTRFSGNPHVQWGSHLCLYVAPDSQWFPSEGMIGYIRQLSAWLQAAATNALDAPEAPMHPPVAYTESDTRVLIQTNTPGRDKWPWLGAAVVLQRRANLVEIMDWKEAYKLTPGEHFAASILLDFELSFEYPRTVRELLQQMEQRGLETTKTIVHLMLAAERTAPNAPMLVVVGAPSRGVVSEPDRRLQHLSVWEIEAEHVQRLKNAALACDVMNRFQGKETPDELRVLIDSVFSELFKWQAQSRVRWCYVHENRPEIVVRRDDGAPAAWFRGKSIAVWGCGALGGLLAEHLVRASAKRLDPL